MEVGVWLRKTRRDVAGFTKATVIHRQDHPADAVLQALQAPPSMQRPIDFGREESPGTVSIHPYGSGHVVVRWLNDGKWVLGMHRTLQAARREQAGFDEEHIAVIRPQGSRKAALVTLLFTDEKNRKLPTLADFFSHPRTTRKDMNQVGLQAIRKIAQLNAGGFSHGHPNRHNLLIEHSNAVRLIDPKDLKRLRRFSASDALKLRLKDRDTVADHVLDLMEDSGKFQNTEIDAFSQTLDEEYERHFNECCRGRTKRRIS